MYKVIKLFTDLQDKNHTYNVGDTYPREGLSPTAERIAELSGSKNRQRAPLIEEIPEAPAEEQAENDVPDTDVGEITEEKPRKQKKNKSDD